MSLNLKKQPISKVQVQIQKYFSSSLLLITAVRNEAQRPSNSEARSHGPLIVIKVLLNLRPPKKLESLARHYTVAYQSSSAPSHLFTTSASPLHFSHRRGLLLACCIPYQRPCTERFEITNNNSYNIYAAKINSKFVRNQNLSLTGVTENEKREE